MSSDFIAIPVKPVEYLILDSSLKFVFRGNGYDDTEQPCDRVFTKDDEPLLRGMLSQIRTESTRASMKELIEMICKSEAGYRLVETWI